MKLRILGAIALFAVLTTGCSGVTTAATAQLSGTYDVALVGDLLFVTSTNGNELRVIDISGSPRDFVRAPNPLEPLSIPVVDQPVELARDVRYDANGAELDGPYVYARGLGSAEISIVAADRTLLKALNRVVAASTVTALAARGPTDGQGPSTLYYATWDGTRGTLWSVSVPPADTLASATLAPAVVVSTEGEAIRTLAVMPDGKSLAVGTRSGAGDTGRTLLLDTTTLTTRPLNFPSPVRRVFTQAAYTAQPAGIPVPAGTRVFGVLDEESCGGQRRCQGLLAVDTATGEISHDVTGNPMAPLVFGRALISGITVQPAGLLLDPRARPDGSSGPNVIEFGLLGIASTTGDSNQSGGEIYFFDADGLRQHDVNDGSPALSSQPIYQDAGGANLGYVDGRDPSSFAFGDGAIHTQTVVLTYQGIVPALKGMATSDADGQRFPAPGVDLPGRVAVGDTIQIIAPNVACTAELTVSSIEPDAVVTSDAIPAECANRTGFTVRAAGTEPYVVEGSVDGFLGRVGPNEGFTYPAPASISATSASCPSGAAYCIVPCPPGQQSACAPTDTSDYSAVYFYHPSGFRPTVPAMRFTFGAGDTNIQRGSQYVLQVTANYQPELIALDASVFPGWYLPGAVAYYKKPGNPETDLVYVTYPSSQGVLEFNPTTIVPDAANATNMVGYR